MEPSREQLAAKIEEQKQMLHEYADKFIKYREERELAEQQLLEELKQKEAENEHFQDKIEQLEDELRELRSNADDQEVQQHKSYDLQQAELNKRVEEVERGFRKQLNAKQEEHDALERKMLNQIVEYKNNNEELQKKVQAIQSQSDDRQRMIIAYQQENQQLKAALKQQKNGTQRPVSKTLNEDKLQQQIFADSDIQHQLSVQLEIQNSSAFSSAQGMQNNFTQQLEQKQVLIRQLESQLQEISAQAQQRQLQIKDQNSMIRVLQEQNQALNEALQIAREEISQDKLELNQLRAEYAQNSRVLEKEPFDQQVAQANDGPINSTDRYTQYHKQQEEEEEEEEDDEYYEELNKARDDSQQPQLQQENIIQTLKSTLHRQQQHIQGLQAKIDVLKENYQSGTQAQEDYKNLQEQRYFLEMDNYRLNLKVQMLEKEVYMLRHKGTKHQEAENSGNYDQDHDDDDDDGESVQSQNAPTTDEKSSSSYKKSENSNLMTKNFKLVLKGVRDQLIAIQQLRDDEKALFEKQKNQMLDQIQDLRRKIVELEYKQVMPQQSAVALNTPPQRQTSPKFAATAKIVQDTPKSFETIAEVTKKHYIKENNLQNSAIFQDQVPQRQQNTGLFAQPTIQSQIEYYPQQTATNQQVNLKKIDMFLYVKQARNQQQEQEQEENNHSINYMQFNIEKSYCLVVHPDSHHTPPILRSVYNFDAVYRSSDAYEQLIESLLRSDYFFTKNQFVVLHGAKHTQKKIIFSLLLQRLKDLLVNLVLHTRSSRLDLYYEMHYQEVQCISQQVLYNNFFNSSEDEQLNKPYGSENEREDFNSLYNNNSNNNNNLQNAVQSVQQVCDFFQTLNSHLFGQTSNSIQKQMRRQGVPKRRLFTLALAESGRNICVRFCTSSDLDSYAQGQTQSAQQYIQSLYPQSSKFNGGHLQSEDGDNTFAQFADEATHSCIVLTVAPNNLAINRLNSLKTLDLFKIFNPFRAVHYVPTLANEFQQIGKNQPQKIVVKAPTDFNNNSQQLSRSQIQQIQTVPQTVTLLQQSPQFERIVPPNLQSQDYQRVPLLPHNSVQQSYYVQSPSTPTSQTINFAQQKQFRQQPPVQQQQQQQQQQSIIQQQQFYTSNNKQSLPQYYSLQGNQSAALLQKQNQPLSHPTQLQQLNSNNYATLQRHAANY